MASPEVSPTLKELVEELHDVKTKWKAIGTQLEIDRATLQRIEVTYKNDPEESFTEMMNEWLNTNDDPSWSKIVKALRSRSVNKPMLAKNVELNKCQDLDTVPLTDPLLDVAVQMGDSFDVQSSTTEMQMLPNHKVEEVPPIVREKIRQLAKVLNSLRIKTYHHINSLQHVTPDELRVIVCNPERCWVGNDHRHICLAKSVSTIFAVISHKQYLNWQNFELLEEIIEAYGDSSLKGDLESYRQEITTFEKDTSLDDLRNIVFTPLGPNRLLMKVPLNGITQPTGTTLRSIKYGLKRNGLVSCPLSHHVSQNSPLAIYFVVPRLLAPPFSVAKLNVASKEIDDRIICTLSKEEVFQLLGADDRDNECLCTTDCTTESSAMGDIAPIESSEDMELFLACLEKEREKYNKIVVKYNKTKKRLLASKRGISKARCQQNYKRTPQRLRGEKSH